MQFLVCKRFAKWLATEQIVPQNRDVLFGIEITVGVDSTLARFDFTILLFLSILGRYEFRLQ